MSRDKSVWFAEEILLDAKLINWQLEAGEWDAVQDMLRAEAQLSRDADTGRLRPKKASEYTLRLIAEVLHIMQLDVEQGSYNRSTLAVAEQCLRLVRSCAAAGTKMQTYISKDISILDSMLTLSAEFQQPGVAQSEETAQQYERCMVVLVQTLGNLVVNNPFNQIIVWDKFDSIILNSLVGPNEQIASAAAMVVYNILLGQPNVLPDDVLLLNSLAYMYANGNTEYPDLIIEYLIGVENTYIEKLYAKLDPECRMLVLSLAYNILMSNEMQDINVSVNFVRFMAHEFKARSDLVLKTVDKYVADAEPREVVCLLDVLAAASCMDAYRDALQADTSLFINCAFLLRAIHKLGKESDNFFTSLNKLYEGAGRTLVTDPLPEPFLEHSVQPPPPPPTTHQLTSLSKSASSENVACAESASECTESESSEHYYECADTDVTALPAAAPSPPAAAATCAALGSARNIDHDLLKVAFVKNINESDESRLPPSRKISLEHKIDIEEGEPPLILDASSPHDLKAIAEVVGARVASPDGEEAAAAEAEATEALRTEAVRTETETAESSPDEPVTEIAAPEPQKEVKRSQNLSTDFNLSEQLERILGTGERRAEHPPAPSATAAAPSPATTAPPAAPTVHIDSPDSHRNRLGAIDMSTPKRVVTSVHSVEQHVAFGFKATLVRVLANLCWKHPINKRHMRELEVIPVLLDCCNIDARNPLIMQWVIFAIRNLCENCPENQEVISQLTLRAPLQSDLLQEMGLALHTDASGRSLRVAPLPN